MAASLRSLALEICLLAGLLATSGARAASVTLQSPLPTVDETNGEQAIELGNRTQTPMLLHFSIQNPAGDDERIVVVTPSSARIEPGQTQPVRLILSPGAELRTERLRYLVIDTSQRGSTKLRPASTRQRVPVVVHPARLGRAAAPWLGLRWRMSGGRLKAVNDSGYVVMLQPRVRLLPSGIELPLSASFVLPGDAIETTRASPQTMNADSGIGVFPVCGDCLPDLLSSMEIMRLTDAGRRKAGKGGRLASK
ncbi:fimbria/pilus periplasmic chaperone [Trinickia mobilis]|uniref:fimbria/pilus periplasmic chaperone n=1 Tax=Trinickia mobilis TaxID=2816356 RepID=UPI001A8D1FAA|nr:fimbria/pilus periplasmic chaperone [Trinickia mobilis]